MVDGKRYYTEEELKSIEQSRIIPVDPVQRIINMGYMPQCPLCLNQTMSFVRPWGKQGSMICLECAEDIAVALKNC